MVSMKSRDGEYIDQAAFRIKRLSELECVGEVIMAPSIIYVGA